MFLGHITVCLAVDVVFCAAHGLTDVGEPMREYQTSHFTIASDSPQDWVGRLGRQLESTREAVLRFALDLGLEAPTSNQRMRVILHEQEAGFRQAAKDLGLDDEVVVGFYDQKKNETHFRNIRALPQVAMIPPGSARDTMMARIERLVVGHEVAHHVMFNIGLLQPGADHPEWWVEGLACLFEDDPLDVHGQRPNELRLADLRTEAKTGQLLPVSQMIQQPYGGSPKDLAGRYAQAWALVAYLRQRMPDAFRVFARMQAARRPETGPLSAAERLAEFQSAFPAFDEGALHDWIETQP